MKFNRSPHQLIPAQNVLQKGKNYKLTFTAPALNGTVDDRDFSAVTMGESIDLIKSRWRKGQDANGGTVTKGNLVEIFRGRNIKILNGVIKSDKLNEIRDNYTVSGNVSRYVTGLKNILKKHRVNYMPTLGNPALNDSSMMIDTLHCRRTSKGWYELNVDKKREEAAFGVGRLDKFRIEKEIERVSNFSESDRLFRTFVHWGDDLKSQKIFQRVMSLVKRLVPKLK